MTNAFRRLVVASVAALTMGFAAFAETKVGSTIESRILLGFKVDDAALGKMLPDGWVPMTLPAGPVGGSNMIMALIDRHLMLDAEGQPGDPSSGPTVAILAYARKDGQKGLRGFVTRVYEEPPVVDPYGNSVAADINRMSGYTDAGGGDRSQTEAWTIVPDAGGAIGVDLSFKVGKFNWSTGGESRPFSAVNPAFSRIYRYDQLAGLAMNAAMGLALNGSVEITVTDPEMAAIFDGSEQVTSIISIPTYIREISLP